MPAPTDDTRALLTPAVRRHLARALPGARVRAVTAIGQGWGAAAFRVAAADGDWVLRLPKPRSYWALEDLQREVALLPLLERRPFEVAIPREARLLRDEGGAAIGALHRLVPGTPLGEVRHPRGRARATLLASIGRALSVLHATPVREAKRHGAREVDLWTEEYVPKVAEALTLLPSKAAAWLEQRAAAFEASGGSQVAPRVLIHGDLSGDHLLVDERGQLSGMIDFADALVADPALDFAGVLNELHWRDLEAVLSHYSGEVDGGALERARFYIDIAPIYQVTDGLLGVGPEERAKGIRRLSARAARDARRAKSGTNRAG